MAEEKSFLQNIKLEISKSFKLTPYERFAFHKLLGLHKSENATGILKADLEKGSQSRLNALKVLITFNDPKATEILLELLEKNITNNEAVLIFNHLAEVHAVSAVTTVMSFIENHINDEPFYLSLSKAFTLLTELGSGNEEVLSFILNIFNSSESQYRHLAISTLSGFQIISHFENLLKEENELITFEVFKSLYYLSISVIESLRENDDEEQLFTYSPDQEDKIILDLRVLTGKMAHKFEEYSNRIKVLFISIMMTTNHREMLIYTMKALTSGNLELIHMTLTAIYKNILFLRDPDKLFRNLISLATENREDNRLIINIFVKYFTTPTKSRQFHILQDKLYSYTVVTLESYFETFRKDFMIRDVTEKSYPENFQEIRKFILERFTGDLKKKLLTFLNNDSPKMINHIIHDIEHRVNFIRESERNTLDYLIEVLLDSDEKSRKNSAARIEDINFEKRYLRNRIIRLCEIIGWLNITEAASALINIYNYLKKYPDPGIISYVVRALSLLNYSYMLGEIEVQLTTGSEEQQWEAMNYLALYNEQRSLTILFEQLQNRVSEDNAIIHRALEILLERDIINNITAQSLLHRIIEKNSTGSIIKNAVLCLGHCGFESDVEYLHNLFLNKESKEYRGEIVRALGMILPYTPKGNVKALTRQFKEYLKDPDFKVRLYSSLYLMQLGDEDAMKSIRDMLIIKNKSVQRDILTILGELQSADFSFFLLTLLKEEYGLVNDILPILKNFSDNDLKEVDSYIINIFRRYEAPEIIGEQKKQEPQVVTLAGAMENEKTILCIKLINRDLIFNQDRSETIALKIFFKDTILSSIEENKGTIAFITVNAVTVLFSDPVSATKTSLTIRDKINAFNLIRRPENQLRFSIQLITDRIQYLNDELIDFPAYKLLDSVPLSLANSIIVDQVTMEAIKNDFTSHFVPNFAVFPPYITEEHFELVMPINLKQHAEAIIDRIMEEESQKADLQKQLEDELKKINMKSTSSSSESITRQMDEVGNKLKASLNDIEKYVQRRSTDRELLQNVRKMLDNAYNQYKVEISRIVVK